MSHHIYTTLGFVVESMPHREAGKYLSIFTHELGMVRATAQGIRFEKSKLRYHAQDFSLATFSLVRGKDVWRIVGAQEAPGYTGYKIPVKSELYIRMLTVLKRLIPGEEKHPELFDVILAATHFLADEDMSQEMAHTFSTQKQASIEIIIMLRILSHLGYIEPTPNLLPFLVDTTFTDTLITSLAVPELKKKAVAEINRALKESHL
jgi:DNA repair protein RecO